MAEETGVDRDFLVRLRGAQGLAPLEPDAPGGTEDELGAARRMRALLDAGLPEEGLIETSRVVGIAMSQVAAASNALVGEALLEPGATELEAAHRYLDAARALIPMMGPAMEYSFKLHLLELIRQAAIGSAQLASGRPAGSQELSVCFADLVDFTRLGQSLDHEQLGALTTRLGELAREVARPPIRLVKMIGDAAMLVSAEDDALLDAAMRLVEAAGSEGKDFPALRAGLARGDVVGRAGDFYGHTVNLASRICDFAFPSSVLCDETVKDVATDGFAFSFAGARGLKGVKGPVKLYRVRRAESSA